MPVGADGEAWKLFLLTQIELSQPATYLTRGYLHKAAGDHPCLQWKSLTSSSVLLNLTVMDLAKTR